mmetsp:Transcript_39553/g.122098  ORF Transcript_39553/g.122098 Transcript_39553/m.122098 type:complete len:225 (+) Transcript_39553:193-867(+)
MVSTGMRGRVWGRPSTSASCSCVGGSTGAFHLWCALAAAAAKSVTSADCLLHARWPTRFGGGPCGGAGRGHGPAEAGGGGSARDGTANAFGGDTFTLAVSTSFEAAGPGTSSSPSSSAERVQALGDLGHRLTRGSCASQDMRRSEGSRTTSGALDGCTSTTSTAAADMPCGCWEPWSPGAAIRSRAWDASSARNWSRPAASYSSSRMLVMAVIKALWLRARFTS